MNVVFKDKSELQQYISVNEAFTLEAIMPDLVRATKKYLVPYLSQAEYQNLFTAYDSDDYDNEEQQALLPIVQDAVFNFAFVMHMPLGGIQVDNSGFHRVETEKEKPIFRYQENNIRAERIAAGWQAIEEMLSFLESNADSFPEWKESNAYTRLTENFVQSATEMAEYVDNLHESRYIFYRMKSIFNRLEPGRLRGRLGLPFYEALKNEIKNAQVSDANKYLLDNFIKPGIANAVFAEAIPALALDVGADGVFQITISGDLDLKEKNPASNAQRRVHVDRFNTIAEEYFTQMVEFLNEKADDYPLFKQSRMFISPAEQRTYNRPGTKIVRL